MKSEKLAKVGLFTFLTVISTLLTGQVAVNVDGSSPDPSAILEVTSGEKGFLPPRLTTRERDDISNPAEGLVIYNRDHRALEIFNGTIWTVLSGGFLCGISEINDVEGNRYNTIQIDTQCWMAENLNTGTMINVSADATDNEDIEKYCLFNISDSCSEYGGLYQWDEMMQYLASEKVQGICPSGWHLPSAGEWQTLINYLGGMVAAADKLKEAGLRHWDAPNTGTNSSGFTAIPGGYRSWFATFNDYFSAYFATSTENTGDPDKTNVWWISGQVYQSDEFRKTDGLSVRCVKN